MEKRLFIQLVEKYLSGKASEAEKELLEEYYHRLKARGEAGLSPRQEADLKELMLQNILRTVKPPAKMIPAYRRRWFRKAAAVLILGAAGAGIWTRSVNKPDLPLATTQAGARDDRPPGGNKAILTLADGSAIVLDQAENGVLAEAGSADILKLADGQLEYRSASPDPQGDLVYNTLSTPKGGQYKLILPDGSKVWLNAASSIRYPTAFTGNERRVEITGEVYFEVARDGDKVFKVSIPSAWGDSPTEVEVLGTHFNIKAYENEKAVSATLLEGLVRLSKGSQNTLLRPGQQAEAGQGAIQVLEGVDTEGAVAWKNGLFQFNDTDLQNVMKQLERWYDVEISYDHIPELHFNGTISRNVPLSQVLRMLEITGNIQFEIIDRQIKIRNI